jgi:hypothetical protein
MIASGSLSSSPKNMKSAKRMGITIPPNHSRPVITASLVERLRCGMSAYLTTVVVPRSRADQVSDRQPPGPERSQAGTLAGRREVRASGKRFVAIPHPATFLAHSMAPTSSRVDLAHPRPFGTQGIGSTSLASQSLLAAPRGTLLRRYPASRKPSRHRIYLRPGTRDLRLGFLLYPAARGARQE